MKLRDRMIPAWALNCALRKRVRPHLYFFWRDLWHVCDDFGQFEANAALLRAVLFATILDRVSERDVKGYLRELHVVPDGIKLYTEDGMGLGKVLGFEQPGLKSLKAEYPAPSQLSEPELFTTGDPPAPKVPAHPERKKEERTKAAPVGAVVLERFDFLFGALARAEGSDPAQLTAGARVKIERALKDIIAVCPEVSCEEIARRAAAYRGVMPAGCRLTANALALNWAKCGAKVPAQSAKPAAAPVGWLDALNAMYPDSIFAPGGMSEIKQESDYGWTRLDAEVRARVVAFMIEKGRSAA